VRTFVIGAAATAVAQLGLGLAEREVDSLGLILGIEALVVCSALLVEMMLGPLMRTRFAARERGTIPPH
jgi:hypothetical protein